MNGKATKRVKKILPVGIAMGILFSASPVTEHKVKAGYEDYIALLIEVNNLYTTFLQDKVTEIITEDEVRSRYIASHENIAYVAPAFQKGQFGITVFDYYRDENFSKNVKIAYPNGKVEYKTIKYGQQLIIKQAGTIVDLTPDEPEVSKHDLLYITQKQLDEGNTGVSLTRYKTYYLQSDNSGRYNDLADKFVKGKFPDAYLANGSGVLDARYNFRDLFNQLPEDQRKLGTITAEPVGKEILSNYVTNNPEELAEFNNRLTNIFADSTKILETPITSVFSILNDGNPYQIIPVQKGTNKVIVKKGSKYLSGKEGNALQYSDVIGDDEVFEFVLIDKKSYDNKVQFHLVNKKGAHLVAGINSQLFHNPGQFDELYFTAKTNNEVHNWLSEWYPGKENEVPKYEKIEFDFDKNDHSIWTAYDSGKLIKNSWIERNGTRYYAGSSGVLLKGWQDIGGNRYYFHPGANNMIVGSELEIEGKYYYFNDSGISQRSVWRGSDYYDASGALIKEGLQEIDGKIYYFQNYEANTKEIRLEDQNVILHFSDKGVLEKASDLNGEALDGITPVTFDGKRLVFERDGSIRKTGVSKIFLPGFDTEKQAVIVYYSLEEGNLYSGWKEIDGKKYHFNNGKHYTFDGYETIDGKKHYFNQEGQALPTGWMEINGKKFYLDKGEKVTGVHEIDGDLYFFNYTTFAYGEMLRDEYVKYNGKGYYSGNDGKLYRNRDTVLSINDNHYSVHIDNDGVVTIK